MAVVDPYALCPCGSGEKFKWCCHKVEPFAERAIRQAESGQVEAALATLDEGLRKSADNPWLAMRKAILLARRSDLGTAREILGRVVQKRPKHVGAQSFLVQLTIRQEGGAAGAAQLQKAMAALPPEQRAGLWVTAEVVGGVLVEEDRVPAGLAHLELADALTPDGQAPTATDMLRIVESNPSISPWLRNPYELAAPPDDLDEPRARRFGEALDAADRGLWASAAAAFDALSAEGTPESDRNLGICRLFLGDEAGAVEAIRRHTSWVGANPETVDLEALCQLISPITDDQKVELLQWTWNVLDRAALLDALRNDERMQDDGPTEIEIEGAEATEAESFVMLDRPEAEPSGSLNIRSLPEVLARVYVSSDRLVLEGFDDGRLDALAQRLRDLAGSAIPPAQPRSESVGQAVRENLPLQTEWLLPAGLEPAEAKRFRREEQRRVVGEVWPDTPMPYLGGRTPRQAARDGDAELPLRAAVCQLEFSQPLGGEPNDLASLRRELKLPDEPPVDPSVQDIDEVHLARLQRVPADRLDDDSLVLMYQRARRFDLSRAIEAAALVLIERPHLLDREGGPGRLTVYNDLANLALDRGNREEAFAWARKGRETVPAELRASTAVSWEMLGLRLLAQVEHPERWVPELVAVLERYRGEEAGTIILTNLMEMGLVQMLPNPDRPGSVMLDTRPLQALIGRYGPRITSATGELGISASRGGIWTPESEAGGSGGVWTPGQPSSEQPPGEKPRLIIPGR